LIEGSGVAEETGAVPGATPARWSEPLRRAYHFGRRQLRLHWTFVKFSLSGGLGYALYQLALVAAYDIAGIEFFVSTLIAAEVSITGGFFVRDLWVFTDGPVVRRSHWARFTQYQAKSLVSTLVIVTATVNILTSGLDVPHYVSTPIGVALGFAWNWVWERGVIWRRQAP
jgi:putative flippase GtrA